MAQELIHSFVAELARAVELPEPIVEFGSLQVEPGQDGDLRPLFAGRPFIGTDMRPGPGVDRVEDLRELSFADGEVGTALCLDTLEHCEDPLRACNELHRVLADGGVCAISSVLLFGIHAYPNDYWRFTPEGFRLLLRDFDDVWVAGIGDPGMPVQVVGVGAKGHRLDLSLERFPTLAGTQASYEAGDGKVRLPPLLVPPGQLVRSLVRDLPRVARQRLGRGR